MKETYVILPDLHVPFHNVILLKKILKFLKELKPNGLIFLGDFLDLWSLAKWNDRSLLKLKDITLEKEYEIGNKVLDLIDQSITAKCKKYYLYGNHEDRYRRFMETEDNGKMGKALISPEIALHLKQRKYKVYTNWLEDSIKLGKHLEIIHGQYCPINAAKKHLDEYEGSVVFGHTHRMQSYISAKRGAWNIGCLCDIDSKGMRYMSKTQRNKWTNGFAIVNIDDTGDFFVNVIQCFNNKFIFNNKLY